MVVDKNTAISDIEVSKGRVQKPESRNLSARGVPPPHSGRNFFQKLTEKN